MSKVLLVDTNLAALPILVDMTRAGHEVHTVGSRSTDTLALMFPRSFHHRDYSNAKQIRDLYVSEGFDALVPGCNDVAFAASCEVAEALSLPGFPSVEVSSLLNTKSAFRSLAEQLGLPVPRTFSREESLSCRGPLIVKPVDSFSGRGVSVLDRVTGSDLDRACTIARKHSRTDLCLIEEFVVGQLYSHSAFIAGQQIVQDSFVEEHCTANPFAVDTSWVDNRLSMSVRESVRSAVERLASHLRLRDGLIHTQFVSGQDNVWLIEPTLRCPGDLYSRLMELSGWENYTGNYWRPFMGLPLRAANQIPTERVIRHTVTFTEPGTFRGLCLTAPLSVKEFYPLTRTGAAHATAPQDRAGVMFVYCGSDEELEQVSTRFVDRSALKYNFSPDSILEGVVECAS